MKLTEIDHTKAFLIFLVLYVLHTMKEFEETRLKGKNPSKDLENVDMRDSSSPDKKI